MDITYKCLQKLISSYKSATCMMLKEGTNPWFRAHPLDSYTTEHIGMMAAVLF
jgi:hypothetical protein